MCTFVKMFPMKTKDCACNREGSGERHTSGIHRDLALLSNGTKVVLSDKTYLAISPWCIS